MRIKGGKATYTNHYVRTSRLLQEQAANRPLFTKVRAGAGLHAARKRHWQRHAPRCA